MRLPQPRLEEEKKEELSLLLVLLFSADYGHPGRGIILASGLLSLYQRVSQTPRYSRKKPRVLVLSHTRVWARKKLLPRASPWTLAGAIASDGQALRGAEGQRAAA